MVSHETRLAIMQGCLDIYPRSQPDRALSTLKYRLTPTCNLSQLRHGNTPIACTHTTGNSNTNLSQVSYRNLLIYKYKQGCNQCENSYQDNSGFYPQAVTPSEVAGAGYTSCTMRPGALYMMYIRTGHQGRRRQRKNLRLFSLVDYTDGYTMEVAHGNLLVLIPTKYA
jgi:hypothetical protein